MDAPDRVVVTQGHHLCGVATRYGDDTGVPAVRDAPHGPLAHALSPLCPAVARWQEQEGARRQAEEAAYYAAKEKACDWHRPHRPKIKPVRQGRATMWTEFWTIHGWDEGPDERPGVSGFTAQKSSATSSVLVAPHHLRKD
ncbi:hypothetical protein ABZ260_39245 [Streptosporangium sp. NPDC006013]|uniref:hypothetical protein n=1 Tax=Streptosporangium sp. NPDC006013 TaxID=3155596 RepID=UPI0033BDBE4C